MSKIFGMIVVVATGLGVLFLFSLVLSLPVMWLWDWIMPELFGLKEITWLQAWGLNFLCGILFRDSVISKE